MNIFEQAHYELNNLEDRYNKCHGNSDRIYMVKKVERILEILSPKKVEHINQGVLNPAENYTCK